MQNKNINSGGRSLSKLRGLSPDDTLSPFHGESAGSSSDSPELDADELRDKAEGDRANHMMDQLKDDRLDWD